MSNALTKAAQRVRWLVDADGVRRDLRPSERLVLLALADDARDAQGGRSRLGPAEIRARTGCSERMVRYAFAHLAAGGHITREEAAPGAAAVTVVHPFGGVRTADSQPRRAVAGVQPVAGEGCNPLQGGGAMGCTPHSSYEQDKPRTHSPQAGAREADFIDRKPPVAEVEPVDQVFAAWDAWRDRAGLPGPVTQTAARRVAVDKAVRDNGLGKVLMMIDTIEREVRAGNFRRKGATGQDTIWATFDAAFEVGHAASLNLLARLLDGDFGPLEPKRDAAVVVSATTDDRAVGGGWQPADRPEPERRLRAALAARLGAKASAVWIDPLRFDFTGDGVVAVAPGAFHADHVATQFAGQLRRAAEDAATGPIRVRVRERA